MRKKLQTWMKSHYLSMLSNHLGIGDPPRNIRERQKSVRYFILVFVPGALVFGFLDVYMHHYLVATLPVEYLPEKCKGKSK